MEKTGIEAAEIGVIGVDCQSSALIPVSAEGDVLHPAMIWADRRAVAEKRWIDANIGQDTIGKITGNYNHESNVAPKLLWLKNNRPDIYAKTDRVLNAAGYIVHCLTGEFSCNISEGGLSQMFDIHCGDWSDELIAAYGLDRDKLPPIYDCFAIVGGLTRKAADELNIAPGTKVVAGSMDAVACGLGCGMVNEGDAFITGGTVTAMGTCSLKPEGSTSLHRYHHIVPGTWCNMAGVDFGGGSYRWFRDQFMRETDERDAYCVMDRLAADVPIGAGKLLYMPTLVGQRCPQWDSNMRGLFFGISPNHTKSHFIRALLEGNAYAVKEICELNDACGIASREITIAGGFAKSALWMKIFSDALGIPLYKAECEEATVLGNMMTAAYGVGLLSSFEDVKKIVKKHRIACDEANHEAYNKVYQVYKTLYPSLKDGFKDLAELNL
jgi:xylulokinase